MPISFRHVKTEIVTGLLAFYDHTSPLKLRINSDASNFGIGAVLHQVTSNGIRPLRYLFRSLTAREQKYSTVEEEECLALVSQ
ncbi:unnamed protein product, partial [Didymodactylos carnosus]